MKFRSHIPKPKGKSLLLLLAIMFTLLSSTRTVYADQFDDAANRIVAIYNGTSDSNRGGNTAIVNGVAYTRTGYLCYLLTKDGSPTGDPAYAFSSPGFNGIAGSKWVCTSRRGHSVSSWRGTAPWNVTPWGNLGSPSYEPQIRDWALQPTADGMVMAQQFVKDIWGLAAAKNFESDEYILVIETIMNFQYSVKGGSGGGGGIDSATALEISNQCQKEARLLGKNLEKTWTGTKEEFQKVIDGYASIIYSRVMTKLAESGGGSGRTFTSDPLIGTVPNLITYKNGNTVFDSYTNKVAPHAEKIKVSEAGFTAYTGSGSLTDSEVQSYGVAMLIIHCKNDSIHTYPIS